MRISPPAAWTARRWQPELAARGVYNDWGSGSSRRAHFPVWRLISSATVQPVRGKTQNAAPVRLGSDAAPRTVPSRLALSHALNFRDEVVFLFRQALTQLEAREPPHHDVFAGLGNARLSDPCLIQTANRLFLFQEVTQKTVQLQE